MKTQFVKLNLLLFLVVLANLVSLKSLYSQNPYNRPMGMQGIIGASYYKVPYTASIMETGIELGIGMRFMTGKLTFYGPVFLGYSILEEVAPALPESLHPYPFIFKTDDSIQDISFLQDDSYKFSNGRGGGILKIGFGMAFTYHLLPRRSRLQIGLGGEFSAALGLSSFNENEKTKDKYPMLFSPHNIKIGPNTEITYFLSKRGRNAIQFVYSPSLMLRGQIFSSPLVEPFAKFVVVNKFSVNYIF